MNKLVTILGLAAVSVSLGLMSACSSSSSSGDTSGTDAGSDGSATSDSGGGHDSGSVTDSGGGNPDDTCTAMATAKACQTCCAGNHTTGAATLTKTVIACACNGVGETGDAGASADGGSGPCAADCAATLCAATPQQPDVTCQKCSQESVSAGGACASYLSTQCTADPDCVAEQTCFQGCPN